MTIFETVPAWPTGSYELETLRFGAASREEAEREGARFVEQYTARRGRAHRAEIRLFCTVCRVTCVKPGCKHKKCEACGGRGTVDLLSK